MNPTRATEIREEKDLEDARKFVRRLIGETCWDVDAPLESLFLYLGRKVPAYGSTIGEWQIVTHATPWDLMHGDSFLARSGDLHTREAMATAAAVVLGTTVTDVAIEYSTLGLAVTFEDRFRLVLDPTRTDESGDDEEDDSEDLDDIGDWQVISVTDHMLIEMGPGRSWRFERSDISQ